MKEKESNHKIFDLQERFVKYAVRIIKVSDNLPHIKAGKHICSQIIRSGTSYGEVQSAESRADFINKLKIVLKEMREAEVWLKMIIESKLIQPTKLIPILKETDELISILFKSIETAQNKKER